MSKITDEEGKKNPEITYMKEREMRNAIKKQRKEMLERDFGLILRIQLQITDGALGKLEALGFKMSDKYTGNHIAIFENELKHPPVLSMIDHDLETFLLAARMRFSNWRLIDLDNFMKGNPPYSSFISQVDWEKQ